MTEPKTRFSKYATLLKKLGKYKTGKACLYVNKLEDVDTQVLEQLIARSVQDKARSDA